MELLNILKEYNFAGIAVGLGTFIIIGVFHPLVIKGYYYFGKRCRSWFAVAGVLFMLASLLVDNMIGSTLLGVTAFSCFWSIGEVTQQAERVRKGWFPARPGSEEDKAARDSRSLQAPTKD